LGWPRTLEPAAGTHSALRALIFTRVTALAFCRFAHLMAAMLTIRASAYRAETGKAGAVAGQHRSPITSLVALLTPIVWLALESASMADDWSDGVAPGLIGAVLTDTARPQP
jgi:hypothetical protein